MALADTSDAFYSNRFCSRRVRDSDETDRAAWCLFARQFSELALRTRYVGSEWIDTKLRSFDTDIRDVLEEHL